MTAASPIEYFTPSISSCPICRERPVTRKKTIYGYPVCKKCFYRFANRRQLGYLVDALIWIIPGYIYGYLLGRLLARFGIIGVPLYALVAILSLPAAFLFIMKDGFSGQSPGNRLTDILVLDERTGQPIGFGQSFKRNSIFLIGHVPFIGSLINLVVILIIAVQVGRGYRLGDRFASTKVIWKRFAQSPVFTGKGLVCEKCGYDLTANTSGVCPECGQPVSAVNAELLAPTPVNSLA